MNRPVVLHRSAERDLDEAYLRAAKNAPQAAAAARWLVRFEAALATLSHDPERCPLAHENGKAKRELRELHFGRRPSVYRVIFTVDDTSVRVLRILRAQRRFLTRRQIEAAVEEE